MEYELVTSTDKDIFQAMINKKLKEGWNLNGNLQSNRTDKGITWFAQAITRTIDNTPQDKRLYNH